MELLYSVITIWLILLVTLAMCFDTKRPMSTKLKYKYRVKDNSIFRKIIKFKDKEHYPCNYFKIVPFYVFLLLGILGLILLLIDILTKGFVTNIIPPKVFTIVMVCILMISIIYLIIVTIWWEVVDNREFKLTKEEKEVLKRVKEYKDNKKP